MTVYVRGGIEHISAASEADMQQSLADLAHAYGWFVTREVAIPGWGRLDLVLAPTLIETDKYHIVIETKTEIRRPAQARKAFQQADGYARWIASQGYRSRVILTAPERSLDRAVTADHEIAYAESVELRGLGEVMAVICHTTPTTARRMYADRRAKEAIRAARLANHARNKVRLLGAQADKAARRRLALSKEPVQP